MDLPSGYAGSCTLVVASDPRTLGLTRATATKLLTKLSRQAVNAARAIVRKKRKLEQELWSGHERHEGRQDVG